MRAARSWRSVVLCVALGAACSIVVGQLSTQTAWAAESATHPADDHHPAADPLALLSPDADLVVQIARPRALAEIVVGLASHSELDGFRGYRDFLSSTNYDLFRKVVAHFEHELGHNWPELLDQVAGGGVVLAIKIDLKPNPEKKEQPPVLFVMQGTDAAQTAKFFATLISVAQQERARSGLSNEYKKDTYRGVETWTFHDELCAAVVGSSLVYSNRPEPLHAAIDRSLDSHAPNLLESQSFQDGRKLLPTSPLVWAWFNLETPKKNPDFAKAIGLPSNFFPLHVVFGGLFDVMRRSPFVVAALTAEHEESELTFRFPRGTDGMDSMVKAHISEDGQPAALPLIEPEGTLAATSVYLDLSEFWKQRKKLLPADQLKQVEQGDEKSSSVLYGTQASKLIEMVGARHRVVVARQSDTGYKTVPKSPLPAAAVVLELRDSDGFAKAIDGPIRGLAFLGQLQITMTNVDEAHGSTRIVGYRFAENDANKARDDGYLFNFSPCRAQVGDKMVFSSTVELAREMIDELEKPAAHDDAASTTDTSTTETAPRAILHHRVRFDGLSQYLGVIQKRLVTQNMLEQGNSPEDAAQEISLFLQLLDHLGRLDMVNSFAKDRYEVALRITP